VLRATRGGYGASQSIARRATLRIALQGELAEAPWNYSDIGQMD
jgi:hypothetical protein